MRRSRGFTLIEMIAVVAILGVLATAAQPLVELSLRRSQEMALRHALREIRQAIDAYKRASAEGRVATGAQDSGYPPSLAVLATGVPVVGGAKEARLYLLRRVPRNPFADPTLPAAEGWGLRSYESPPDAPRPGRDVFDIYAPTERTALDGSAYRDW